jgi:peptidoglycan hydrolase CwlO-like protein
METIRLFLLFVMLTIISWTSSATTSLGDYESEEDSLKCIVYQDYALLLEYAELGYDLDSIVEAYDTIIMNLESGSAELIYQAGQLQTIISELQNHIETLEKKIKRQNRKLIFNRIYSYTGTAAIAILAIVIVN